MIYKQEILREDRMIDRFRRKKKLTFKKLAEILGMKGTGALARAFSNKHVIKEETYIEIRDAVMDYED